MSAKVWMRVTEIYLLEIDDADDWDEARYAAVGTDLSNIEPNKSYRIADVIMVGTPLRVVDDYPPNPMKKGILWCEAPHGSRLTFENREAIFQAIWDAGLRVSNSSSSSITLEAHLPKDSPKPTDEQLARINDQIKNLVPDYSESQARWERKNEH